MIESLIMLLFLIIIILYVSCFDETPFFVKEDIFISITEDWKTFGICNNCYSYAIDVPFNDLIFVWKKTCPVCGATGCYSLITARKNGKYLEILIGENIFLSKTQKN